jgi:uncharacterized peroxidase-related enzyme
MTYVAVVNSEHAPEDLKGTYNMLEQKFMVVPKVFAALSLRPDLLEPLAQFVIKLMIDDHKLNRGIKELIAAYVSKINSCAYCVDAHSAMAMAQGFTEEQVKSILEDVNGSLLLDAKTKQLLQYAENATRHAYKITEEDIQRLRGAGCSDQEILEATLVVALFNFIDRIADALGVEVENFVGMMKSMK